MIARFFFQDVIVSVAALALLGSASPNDRPAVPWLAKARVVIDLAEFGWMPPRDESNRSFFNDVSIDKIEALDDNTKIAFLSEDLLVAYHTKQEGKNWRSDRRELEAFFIRTADGSLRATKRWPTSVRKASFDRSDSEARLIPLSDGRFLVHAGGVLMLYGNNLELLREKRLEPSRPIDLWAAQSIPGCAYISLRHGFASSLQAAYSWLNSETLELSHQLSGSFWAGVATENSIITGSPSGIQEINMDGHAQIICGDPHCQKSGPSAVLSSRDIAFEGRAGIGVIKNGHGLLWWDSVPSDHHPQIYVLSTAMSAPRLAVDVSAPKETLFHGTKIKNGSPVMFVYDAQNGEPLRALRLKLRNDVAYNVALSPDGTQVAVFDAHGLKIYSLDAP